LRCCEVFLVDECLSVDLVTVAGASGHEARHVGRAGWKDWNVTRYASDGDFVLVTNNASDFRQLYAAQPLHAGLVILIPAVNRVVRATPTSRPPGSTITARRGRRTIRHLRLITEAVQLPPVSSPCASDGTNNIKFHFAVS
jgi:Domain of unknown function (DUF5615)